MKPIIATLTIMFCLTCSVHLNAQVITEAQAAEDDSTDDRSYDLTAAVGFPGSAEGWYSGPYATVGVSIKLNFANVAAYGGTGICFTIDDNRKLYMAGGLSAWTGAHYFEAGTLRYGLGNASRPWLDGSAENGWMHRLLYGYRIGALYPFVEGGLAYGYTHEERYDLVNYTLRLTYEETAKSQSWWAVAGGIFEHELRNHIVTNLKLGVGVDHSQATKTVWTIDAPEATINSVRKPGFIVVCGFGIGYRFR